MSWSKKQSDFILSPFDHTLDVAEGTPRSGKTTACVMRFFCFLNTSKDENFLVVATNQPHAFRLVMDADGNGLIHLFGSACRIRHDEHGDYLEAHSATGKKKVYYKGGAKADSDKSVRGLSLGGVYFCEIDQLHMNMIQECFRRTYVAHIRWHLADLNPPAPHHPVIGEVFEIQNTYWTHWTPNDNPAMTEERKKELHDTLKKNKYLYQRDWLGQRCVPEGVIYSMFSTDAHVLEKLPDNAKPIEMFFSGDGGLTDATSISCNIVCGVEKGWIMYRVANWYYDGGNKAMSTQAKEIVRDFLPYCRKKFKMTESDWYIDPACKALRKELELLGVDTRKADNNAKEVKGIRTGIEYAQSAIQDKKFFLVENDDFGHEHFLKELGGYCVDDNGNPIDKNNHAMDEFRYSINHFVKEYVY